MLNKFRDWLVNNWGPIFIIVCMIAAVLIGAFGPPGCRDFLEMKP